MPYDKPKPAGAPKRDGAPGRGSKRPAPTSREGDMWRRYMKDHC